MDNNLLKIIKIAVTGSRKHKDYKFIEEKLLEIVKEVNADNYILIHGGAYGADQLSGKVAKKLGWDIKVYNAEWDKYGKRAGPLGNQKIIDEAPDYLIAFPLDSSIGTYDTIRKADKYNEKNEKKINIMIFEKK